MDRDHPARPLRFRKLLASIFTFLALTGCQQLVDPLPEPATMEGVVLTYVETATDHQITIQRPHGPWSKEGCEPCDQAIIHLQPATIYFASRGQLIEPATAPDLEVGSKVLVWTTDAELRSLPPQYYGTQVIRVID